MRAWAFRAIGAFVIGAVLYLALGNAALMLGPLKHGLNRHPEELQVHYTSAYTLWPGHLHITGLDLRFEDDSLQIQLKIADAGVRLSLWGFTQRRFHATRVRAEGVSWRTVDKVQQVDGNLRRIAAFPPIDNPRGGPPVSTPRLGPPPTEPPQGQWTLKLDDITAQVDEVWIVEYRWLGNGLARGSLEFTPGVAFWLAPSQGKFEDGTLSVGTDVLSTAFNFETSWSIAQFQILEAPGALILESFSVTLDVDAPIDSAAPLSLYLPGMTVGGAGRVAAHARIIDGRITPDTRVDVALDWARVKTKDVTYKGSAKASLKADRFHVSTAGEAQLAGDLPLLAQIKGTFGDGVLETRDTWKGLAPKATKWTIGEVRIADASAITNEAAKKAAFLAPAILGNGPLVARGNVEIGQDTILHIDSATLGDAELAGALKQEDEGWSGAAVGKVGPLPLGVRVSKGAASVVPFIQAGWLEAELQRVGIGEATPVR